MNKKFEELTNEEKKVLKEGVFTSSGMVQLYLKDNSIIRREIYNKDNNYYPVGIGGAEEEITRQIKNKKREITIKVAKVAAMKKFLKLAKSIF